MLALFFSTGIVAFSADFYSVTWGVAVSAGLRSDQRFTVD